MSEPTLQRLDPPTALATRPVTIAAAVIAVGYAGLNTVVERHEIDHPLLALTALMLVTLAAVILLLASSPLRAPFRRLHSSLVLAAGIGAAVAAAAASFASNSFIRDDWGPISLGILLFGLFPYRPAREIAGDGVIAASAVGLLALVQAPAFDTPVPPQVFSLVAMAPVLALAFGAAALTAGLRSAVERWRRRAERASDRFGEEMHQGIARSVQQEHVTVLNRDVVPFLLDVVHTGSIDHSARARAAELSSALRAVVVAGVDRVWLETVLEELGESHAALEGDVAALETLEADERVALRAFLARLVRHRAFAQGSVRVALKRSDARTSVRFAAEVGAEEVSHRSAFGPYLAVLRVTFPDLLVTSEGNGLRLQFSYGNR